METTVNALDLSGVFGTLTDTLQSYAPQILTVAGGALVISLGFWGLKYGVRMFKGMAK